jgi:hypothetical protein
VPKTHGGEKTASSTNVARKTGYLPAENWNYIHVCQPVPVACCFGKQFVTLSILQEIITIMLNYWDHHQSCGTL